MNSLRVPAQHMHGISPYGFPLYLLQQNVSAENGMSLLPDMG